MPVTAPPLKATSNAGAIPPVAAWAVRTFAFTDTFIPIKPHAPDNTAPTTNPMAVVTPKNMATNIANATPTIAIVLYCRAK